jgi:hypothetical protein
MDKTKQGTMGIVPMERTGTTMKRHALVLTVLLALGCSAAMAATPGRACLLQAREDLQSCSGECVNDFRNERFTCRNVEPGCGRECLGHRESCIETASQPLVDCVTGCQNTLAEAKAACVTTCNGDTSCLDTCTDQAQVDAFTCRDNCREEFHMGPGPTEIESCRATFRECVRACPPAQ